MPEGLLTGGVGLDGGGAHPLQLLQPEGDLQPAHLIPQEQKAPGFFRLLAEGPHLELQLVDLVPDAHQVLLGPLQAALGLLLPVAEAGDARGLLKDLPAVGAFDREDLVDLALADDGVALPSQSGVHKELVHVPEADGAAVDVIFALPGAVVAAGHHDLILRQGEGVVPVIQHQADLGKAHLPALLGSAEDHILHLAAPERTGGLLPHHPADGVRQIGFARAVGTHDGGDIFPKGQHSLVRKGLEPLDLERF